MSKIDFFKMTGSGNDFVVINNLSGELKAEDLPELARKICRRGLSLGADGLILIEPSYRADFYFRYLNADGSYAEMCGNGGRCVARFAYLKGIAGPKMSFDTLAGIITAEVIGPRVKLKMTPPTDLKIDYPLDVSGKTLTVSSINTGVPHVVVFVDDVEAVDVEGLGREIRYHPHYQPAGTNADFVQVVGPSKIIMRTYERGVEGETLACGTGACASALVTAEKGLADWPISVQTRGGEILTIHYEEGDIFLEGEARVICEGILWDEALLGG